MKKTLLALALAAGLTSFAGNAKAGLTFDYTMIDHQDPFKSVYLALVLNDAGTAATSATISGSTGGVHFDANRNFVSGANLNAFSVDNGKITSALFDSYIENRTKTVKIEFSLLKIQKDENAEVAWRLPTTHVRGHITWDACKYFPGTTPPPTPHPFHLFVCVLLR